MNSNLETPSSTTVPTKHSSLATLNTLYRISVVIIAAFILLVVILVVMRMVVCRHTHRAVRVLDKVRFIDGCHLFLNRSQLSCFFE